VGVRAAEKKFREGRSIASRARVQANRLLSGLVPIGMDHHSSGGLLAKKSPTFACRRQDTGATTLLGFRRPFYLTTLRDVAQALQVRLYQ
jgi:hypothetical protein